MWVLVVMEYDGPAKVLGVFNNQFVAREWSLDNGYEGRGWIMEVEKPEIPDMFLVKHE